MATSQNRLVLQSILQNSTARSLFQKFLESVYCAENLLFLDSVENFRKLTDPAELKATAQKIWDEYLSESATYQVNLDASTLDVIKTSLAHPTSSTFDAAIEEVLAMLEHDSVPKFLRSPLYLGM